VIVRGDRIQLAGPERDVAIPPGYTEIDGHGKYVLSGLADMHVHLPKPTDLSGTAESEFALYLANSIHHGQKCGRVPESP
jgi:imidazolonepropionase-like amidohydrolase